MNKPICVKDVKSAGEDFEWYPTTEEILAKVRNDIAAKFTTCGADDKQPAVSILDCGAGDGRACLSLSGGGKMYAIEKSKKLISAMDSDIFVIGTEFHEATLIDKEVEIVFCNPPYSEFEIWACKIIREANCSMAYLVIPERWKDDRGITEAIKDREAKVSVIGSFDFLNAERKARAKVEVLAISLADRDRHSRQHVLKVDPFTLWFDETFPLTPKGEEIDDEKVDNSLSSKVAHGLTIGMGVISVLVELYNNEMAHLALNYSSIGTLDQEMLREMGVDLETLREGMRVKIKGLKTKYWHEFFNSYADITSRLTTKSREIMLEQLQGNTAVDFTEDNAYAVTIWAIKNANKYYDAQVVELFDGMIGEANVILYKSNFRTFGAEDWRWGRKRPEGLDKFSLEYRIVLDRYRAIKPNDAFYSWEYPNELYKDVHFFIKDILTVANNFGFISHDCIPSTQRGDWKSGKKENFAFTGGLLMEVKAFKNGNVHIKFNQKFIRQLNVEFGRLKGWVKNHQQASDEMNIPVEEAAKYFKGNFQLIGGAQALQIGFEEK